MKGYKAFEKGLICKGKQYAENTVFEEDNARIGLSGMHFCESPLEVLRYYPLVNTNGIESEFAKVETLDEKLACKDKLCCTKKLRIGEKIGFAQLVQDSINLVRKNRGVVTDEDDVERDFEIRDAVIGSSGNDAQIGSSGDFAQIGSSGDYAVIGSSGDFAQIGSSGDYAVIGSSGYRAQIGSSGYRAQIGSSGDCAQIGFSGDRAQIGSSGIFAQIGSSGDYAVIGSSGNDAQIGSSGIFAQIGSSGDCAQIGSSGDLAQINSTGSNSVICCAGKDCRVSGKIGSWITLAEWEFSEKEKCNVPICVKTVKIDGLLIKEDTYYRLENGEFVECVGEY